MKDHDIMPQEMPVARSLLHLKLSLWCINSLKFLYSFLKWFSICDSFVLSAPLSDSRNRSCPV